jgi:4-hydroxybenzoate polyprenyltransferase
MGKLRKYAQLIRLNRPIGIYLLLWPCLWALWLSSNGDPDIKILTIFVLGVIFIRSAGCAINDFIDRKYDVHVHRTKNRPIATGEVKPLEALVVFFVLSISAFSLVSMLNNLTILLSLVGILLIISYPFMKRLHYLPQVHLGISFAWSVPMVFAAQTGKMPTPEGWLLFIAAVLWTTVYDTMYAMADKEDDVKIGVKSTAILFGPYDRAMLALLQILLVIVFLFIGYRANFGVIFFSFLLIAAWLMINHQFLIIERKPIYCIDAFTNNNYVGFFIFAGISLDYLANQGIGF